MDPRGFETNQYSALSPTGNMARGSAVAIYACSTTMADAVQKALQLAEVGAAYGGGRVAGGARAAEAERPCHCLADDTVLIHVKGERVVAGTAVPAHHLAEGRPVSVQCGAVTGVALVGRRRIRRDDQQIRCGFAMPNQILLPRRGEPISRQVVKGSG
jgi:hypothetical protein